MCTVCACPIFMYDGCYWCSSVCLKSYSLLVGLEGTMAMYGCCFLSGYLWLCMLVGIQVLLLVSLGMVRS